MKSIFDDIENISRGRSSRHKIGSRAVPHRLTEEERLAFELAKKKGFLSLPVKSRVNTINIYKKYCQARKQLCIIHFKSEHDSIRVYDTSISKLKKMLSEYALEYQARGDHVRISRLERQNAKAICTTLAARFSSTE